MSDYGRRVKLITLDNGIKEALTEFDQAIAEKKILKIDSDGARLSGANREWHTLGKGSLIARIQEINEGKYAVNPSPINGPCGMRV